jgi:hypothetical protein
VSQSESVVQSLAAAVPPGPLSKREMAAEIKKAWRKGCGALLNMAWAPFRRLLFQNPVFANRMPPPTNAIPP